MLYKITVFFVGGMMPTARCRQVSLEATPYYHCIGRCVRRAFLWGKDDFSGRDYSHRKAWVTTRLSQMAQVFAVNICAYAVMSNHYHLVLHIDAGQAKKWTEAEVAHRWSKLFTMPTLLRRYLDGGCSAAEMDVARQIIAVLRSRLCDLSWYMRCLNEFLARLANLEDKCTGRFWEGRFKSQAILDEGGLLACCMYVDLNPVRAGAAKTLEEADFTGLQQRLFEHAQTKRMGEVKPVKDHIPLVATPAGLKEINKSPLLPPLHPFAGKVDSDPSLGLPYQFKEYLELADWTARAIQPGKRGATPAKTPPVLNRLGLDSEYFLEKMQSQAMRHGCAIGPLEMLRSFAARFQRQRGTGIRVQPSSPFTA